MSEKSEQPASQESSGGQVSEVSTMEGAAEPIMPDQSVAGAPDADSGEVQEGRQGPNARTGDEDERHRNDV